MKKGLLLLTLMITFGQISAQEISSWSKVAAERTTTLQKVRTTEYSNNQQLFALNESAFKASLAGAPERLSGQNGVVISLPTTSGTFEKFAVWETSNFAPGLRTRFPEIKSYIGKGITDRSATLSLSVAPIGIQTMVLRAGQGSEFIEAYTKDRSVYVLFDSASRISGQLPFSCGTDAAMANSMLDNKGAETALASNQVFKTFRLALSCTGEYTTFFGGTVVGALSGMNATMARVNGVFEKDLALRLEIIENTDLVIYTSASTDPYSNATVGASQANANNANGWNIQLQNTLTTVLGNAAYDIGHLFGGSGGGGNAGCIGCVCDDDSASTMDKNKGSGYTSPSDDIPQGDTFDIDYVAHEMGHQLGANHTFSHAIESAGVNIEPGSGSTIMGYAGITIDYDVQSNSDDFFAYRSINQIQINLTNKTCSVDTPIANNPPTVSAGQNFTIPIGTAFILQGSATDAEEDVLTYVWEQNDTGNSNTTAENSEASPTKTSGPNFRTYQPVAEPIRYMPQLSTVLSGTLSSRWESVSNVSRSLNFNLTARDNAPGGAQTGRDACVILVSAIAGPFEVTSQNAPGTTWLSGETQEITWNVNNTTTLAGSSDVIIRLSIDGGLTYPIILADNTPNDGSHTFTVPSLAPAEDCRIMIKPVGNIYFAVNSRPFSIGYECNVTTVAPNAEIPDGGATVGTYVSTIEVTDVGIINNMELFLNVQHARSGDLVIRLTHPDGTVRTVWNRTCNSAGGADINVTLVDSSPSIACGSPTVGTFRPVQLLAPLNGKPTNGPWTLTVIDNAAQNTGTLVSWGVNFGCTLGNSEFDKAASFAVFPNPSKGNFTVQFNNDAGSDINILVHDLRGRKIFENKYNNDGLFNQNIQLDNAQSGIYLVTVQAGGEKFVKKIVVE